MATNSQGDNVSKTVSMETSMWEAAEARAKALGFRAFSAYVQSLLRKDLQDRPDIVLSEKPGSYVVHPKANELNETGRALRPHTAAEAIGEIVKRGVAARAERGTGLSKRAEAEMKEKTAALAAHNRSTAPAGKPHPSVKTKPK